MRIYLTGSQSSGKSTLARYISKKYNLNQVSEIARTVLAEKELQLDQLRTDLDIVDDFQTEILIRQIKQEADCKGSYVSDRSFDCLTYTAQHSRVFSTLLKMPELKDYIEILKQPDSIIFFVRPSKDTMKQDGVRENLSWDGIVAIDAMTKMLIEMFELKYFQINTTNMQERVRFVDSILSLVK